MTLRTFKKDKKYHHVTSVIPDGKITYFFYLKNGQVKAKEIKTKHIYYIEI